MFRVFMIKLLAVVMVLGGVTASNTEAAEVARVGDMAPQFTVMDINGVEHSLAALRGKIVVLEWFNYDCPFVKKHYSSGAMQKLQASYTAEGIVWISVNSSAKGKQGHYGNAEMQKLAEARNARPTAIVRDETGELGRLYGARTTPHLFVIDATGILRYAGAVDSIRSVDADDVAKADNYLVRALEALKASKVVDPEAVPPYGCSVKY